MADSVTINETTQIIQVVASSPDQVTISPNETSITITEVQGDTVTITEPVVQVVQIQSSASLALQTLDGFTTSDLAEGSNLYYTDLRASAAAPVQSLDMPLGYTVTDSAGDLTVSVTNALQVRETIGAHDAANLSTGDIPAGRIANRSISDLSDVGVLDKTEDNIMYTDGTRVLARQPSNWNLTDFTNDLTSGDLPAHTHAATDITSGTLSISVIPDLSGTYALASHTHTMSDITDLGDLEINDLANVNVAMGAGNDGDLLFYDHAAGAGAKIKGVARSSIDLSEFNNDLPAVADSYVMMIEVPSDKTYYLDPKVIAARTITSFYAKTSAGTCTAWLKQGGLSVGLIAVTTSGGTSSVTNTSVSANAVIQVDVSSTSSAEDLQIMVGYTQ